MIRQNPTEELLIVFKDTFKIFSNQNLDGLRNRSLEKHRSYSNGQFHLEPLYIRNFKHLR